MQHSIFIHHNDKLSKWLMAVSLFFSIFVFGGFTSNPVFFYQQKSPTELVCSINNNSAGNTASYKKTIASVNKKSLLFTSRQYQANIFLYYNALIKTAFDHTFKNIYSFTTAARFIQIKINPTYPDEGIPPSIKG